jgi:hypothetical protein
MATLYIIGNGFDLWHQLPTSYSSFYDFAKVTLDEIETYYSFGINQTDPWHDFENALGCFNWEHFYDAHNNIDVNADDFRPSFVYGLEDDLCEQADQHVEAVRECFREWIAEIDISAAKRRMVFPNNARFITFNYTSTLQSSYGITGANILHIHGQAEAFDELIFGHGEKREEEPELDENGDSNRTIFSDAEGAAMHPFYALQKPVKNVLDSHRNFFSTLQDVSEIIVIGHSLNKIDLPYFLRISELTPSAKWTVCLHNPEEKIHRMQVLIECGVSLENINFCSYTDLEGKHDHRCT